MFVFVKFSRRKSTAARCTNILKRKKKNYGNRKQKIRALK